MARLGTGKSGYDNKKIEGFYGSDPHRMTPRTRSPARRIQRGAMGTMTHGGDSVLTTIAGLHLAGLNRHNGDEFVLR